MENEKIWIKELKEKRLAYGVSQNKLAVASHITRPYYRILKQARQSLLNR